jgi:rubrerythrin
MRGAMVEPLAYFRSADAAARFDRVLDFLVTASESHKSEEKEMVDEVLSLLNEPGMDAEALKVFRQWFGLVNVFQCEQCGYQSSHYDATGCPECGRSNMDIRVVQEKG